MFVKFIRPAISLLVLMTLLLGLVYPLVITGLAKIAFPRQAEGSLIYKDGKLIGSTLIGQSFSDPKYFWGRPSATTPQPYNGLASSGSNLGPLNPALLEQVKANAKALHDADPDNRRLEIGSTWLGRPWRRTAVNTEAKLLMLGHAFEAMGCARVEFKADSLNERSRVALLRIGAYEE